MKKKISFLGVLIFVMALALPAQAALVSPLTDTTATGAGGNILTLAFGGVTYTVADGDLTTGTSVVSPNSHSTYKQEYADNFSLNQMATIDDRDYIETKFSFASTVFFIFENGGNDNPATIQALDVNGALIAGTSAAITSGSWYDTDIRTTIGSYDAFGAAYQPQSSTLAYGFRITKEGYDPVSHSVPTPIPGAVWLLGSGLVGLVAIRRRFKK
jgi:hypothetical protein